MNQKVNFQRQTTRLFGKDEVGRDGAVQTQAEDNNIYVCLSPYVSMHKEALYCIIIIYLPKTLIKRTVTDRFCILVY